MDTVPVPTANNAPAVTAASPSDGGIILRELSFPALNAALDDYIARTGGARADPWERWSLIICAAGAGLGMLLGSALTGTVAIVGALLGLTIEIAGLSIAVYIQIRRDWREFVYTRSYQAKEIEDGYTQYQQLVKGVRTFSLEERRARHRYIRERRIAMHERLSLFTGGVERLGLLPLLAALYLQFKDWQWGDWNAFSKLTLTQGLLAFLILTAYALSWYLLHLRARIRPYEQLLAEANAQDEDKQPAKI